MVFGRAIRAALAASLLLGAPLATAAAQSDVIRGRVTTVDGLALQGVRITATSIPGNVTREVRTDSRGNFQIVFPGGTGDYMMGFALIGYVYHQREIKRLADEDVLLANATLSVVQLDTINVVAPVQQRVNRNSSAPDVSGTERQINTSSLPTDAQGDVAAMAASLPGVALVPGIDGSADGFSVLGLGTEQNNTTLNGLPTGANGLPRDASVRTSLSTSPYDVSRGGFSGANFNIQPNAGSNFRTRGMSLVVTAPQSQWTDQAGQELGSEYTNVSVGGNVSGPLVLNKAFYNMSYQFGRQARDNQTLFGTSAVGLQTAGVAADSVVRLSQILATAGVPGLSGPLHSQRLSDNGSFLGTIDVSPPSSTSGQSMGFTFNGQWSKQTPAFGGATQLASASGDRTNWSGGVQGRHSSYFKMVLSETQAGLSMSRDFGDPYLNLPAGRVRVTSDFAQGSSGVQSLVFGGNQGLSSSSQSRNASVTNTLSLFDNANRHRVKFTTELNYSASRTNPASNMLGTFTFNSLEDLEAGIPASYTRTLNVRERESGQLTAAVALGDSYRRTQDFQLQYGVRVDATRYALSPEYNPAIEAQFGRRNDRIPTPVAVSPRIGFSWTLGDANELQAFFGQARAPRAVVRGGVAVLSNSGNSGQLGAAVDNTGLPSGTQQIYCVGSAVPVPDWTLYATNAGMIPSQCTDGTTGSAFSNSAPNVTLISPSYAPPRNIRSNLSWQGAVLDARFNLNLEATYSVNMRQQRSVDLNFDNVERFALPAEARPIFVDTSSIVAASGSIAARDARLNQSFARVSDIRSDLRSHTAQGSLRFSPRYRTPAAFTWSGAYTFTSVREQFSGFNSTSASPLSVAWGRGSQGPHQISYSLSYLFFRAMTVSWNGQFRSGQAYTPMIAGDINGDGYNNDRAFVYPANTTADSATAAGMTQLLANASSSVRECLEGQVGRIANRNSCRGPWSSTASLNVTFDRAKFRMPQRASISFSLSNPLGAADLLINGSGHLRGWGQTPSPDASLLYVRGFDMAARQYRYEVNQRFGATRPQFLTLRSPVVLTMNARFDLGPTRERQNVEQNVGAGRNRPGSRLPESFFRQSYPSSVFNPLTAILRQQDTLRLTARQADSIAVLNRRYTYRADSIWAPVARHFATLKESFDVGDAYDRYIKARRAQIDLLMQYGPAVNGLLTPEQRRKLSPLMVSGMDPRYLLSIRNGTNTFVGGGNSPGAPFIFFGGGGVEVFRQ